jgi:transmembrane sensor
MDVRVLGTHFNLNGYANEESVKATLLEGSVLVTSKALKSGIVLKPGQQARLDANQLNLGKDINTEEVIAWKNGRFQFNSADIKTVMRQVERWYDVDAVIKGDFQSVHISGEMPRNLKLSQVAKILELSGIQIKMDGRNLLVAPKP